LPFLAAWTAFVDLAIAVVIEIVVAIFLGGRSDLADTSSPGTSRAGFDTGFAGSYTLGGWGRAITGAGLSILAAWTAFVDLAIAVVIEAVVTVFLGGGFDFACAGSPLSARTGFDTGFASPRTLCPCWPTIARSGLSVRTSRGATCLLDILLEEAIVGCIWSTISGATVAVSC
jgi:hypothetical protein